MKRREAIKTAGLISGYTLLLGSVGTGLYSCSVDKTLNWNQQYLNQDEVEILQVVTDMIIPTTDTPGAKEAMVERFIDANIHDNFSENQKLEFREGLKVFNTISQSSHSKPFVKLKPEKQVEVLKKIAEIKETNKSTYNIFETIRDMTVFGFCTSEVGAKDFLSYDPIPGDYFGCLDYIEVGGTWSY